MKPLNNRIAHLELPQRLRRLAVSDEGYPIPWFVGYIDGKPDFRCMDGEKLGVAIRHKRCWQCGEPLGRHLVFTIGPMCLVNRTISEPPSHYDCAHYAVQACPFLTQPRMRRNEVDKPDGTIAGHGLKRNPGAVALWITSEYRVFKAPNGGVLFRIGEPERVEFYAEGRPATRDEVMASMESGLPLLHEVAEQEGRDAVAELDRLYANALQYLPKAPEGVA
jgi:hypothetical protein